MPSRAMPAVMQIEFAREFQAGTAFAPLPAAFFNRIVAESLKLPRLTTYRDIGHCPNWECPKRVAADLLDFLEQG